MSQMPSHASAAIGGRSFDLTASVTMAPDDEGALYATGTQNAGLTVFVQNRRLVLDYNAFGDHTVVASSIEVPAGDVTLGLHLRRTGRRSGTAALSIDGTPVGQADLPLFMGIMSSIGSSVGSDHGSAVSPRYAAPFTFSGALHELVIQLSPEKFATEAAEIAARTEMSRQ
jgi:arylsulfatase